MNETLTVVTRPQPQCEQLCDQLLVNNLPALAMPAMGFRVSSIEGAKEALWPKNGSRLAVFTSPRAVEFAFDQISTASLAQAAIAAIGPATARALQAHGLEPVKPEHGYTSEALLAMPQWAEKVGNAVIFAAPGGRDVLCTGLQALGWTVKMAYVYHRVLLAPAPEAVSAVLAARHLVSVWTSTTAMDSMLDALPDDARDSLLGGTFVVISERLEAHARQGGAKRVVRASGPDNEALLKAVLQQVRGAENIS